MASKIITVYNQKGGCGKTQTSMQFGAALALRGYKTLVIDMDTQGTAVTWSSQASDIPFPARVVSLAVLKKNLIGEVRKLVQDYQMIVIDCPPAIESEVPWAALQISDLGLIPVMPVLDNIWASKEACSLGLKAKKDNPELELRFLPTMNRRGKLFEHCLTVLKEDSLIPVLKTVITLRNAFPESQVEGKSVHGLGKKTPAALEIEQMTDEVLRILKVPKKGGKSNG